MITTMPTYAGGPEARSEMFVKSPHLVYLKMDMPGIGPMQMGFDGKTAWTTSAATGPMILEATRAVTVADGNEMVERTESMSHAPFDEKIFAPPPEVQKLLDKQTGEVITISDATPSPLGDQGPLARLAFNQSHFLFQRAVGLPRVRMQRP